MLTDQDFAWWDAPRWDKKKGKGASLFCSTKNKNRVRQEDENQRKKQKPAYELRRTRDEDNGSGKTELAGLRAGKERSLTHRTLGDKNSRKGNKNQPTSIWGWGKKWPKARSFFLTLGSPEGTKGVWGPYLLEYGMAILLGFEEKETVQDNSVVVTKKSGGMKSGRKKKGDS